MSGDPEPIDNYISHMETGGPKGVDNADVDWFLRDNKISVEERPSKIPLHNEATVDDPDEKLSAPLHTTPTLLLSVSNTHETNVNKAKASVSQICEKDVHPNAVQEYSVNGQFSAHSQRKNSVSSNASASSIDSTSSSNGFFSKLRNKLQRSDSRGSNSSHTNVANSNSANSDRSSNTNSSSTDQQVESHNEFGSPTFRVVSNTSSSKADETDIDDPRLREYVFVFRQNRRRSSCMKMQNSKRNNSNTHVSAGQSEVSAQPSKLSTFFRKMSVSSPPVETAVSDKSNPSHGRLTPGAESQIPPEQVSSELKKMRSLKHVAFHSQTFLIDPPQQIPSRNPRKGNVEILPSGVVRINPLTEADKIAIEKSLKGQGGGLVVGGTGLLGQLEKDSKVGGEKEGDATCDGAPCCDEGEVEVDRHASSLQIEKPMMHPIRKFGYTIPVKKMALDLMYTRCCHLREILPVPAILKQIPEGSTAPLPILQLRNPNPTMVEVQTFADFIRIAPIICVSLDGVNLSIEQFSILLSSMCAKKQLEKLTLRNTPIDLKGWELLCWFLSQNKVINKLDITQCPPLSLNLLKRKKKSSLEEQSSPRMTCNRENRSDMDWTLFTAALIVREGIEELIMTGCCITDLSIFKALITRAVTLKTLKLGLAYNQISPQQLDCVLEHWVFSENCRGLDLGYNDLSSSRYLKIFTSYGGSEGVQKITSRSQIGFLSLNATNLRFNDTFRQFFENFIVKLPMLKYLDMSNNPKLFNHFSKPASLPHDGHGFNSAHEDSRNRGPSESNRRKVEVSDVVQKPDEVEEGNEHWRGCIHGAESIPEFLSESVNTFFCSRLPRFHNLARLHLENNALSSQDLKSLFEVAPFCKSLNYLSIIGNQIDIYSATSLLQCLRYSTSLITVDADYSKLPEVFKERIGLYSMRNMNVFFNKSLKKSDDSSVDAAQHTASSMTLTDELNQLLSRKADEKLDLQSPEVRNIVSKIKHHRFILQDAFADLFDLQYKRELNMEGKETLIRLLFVDSALQWALKLVGSSSADKDGSINSTDIINMYSAEDEPSESKSSMLSKPRNSYLDEQNTLSPVKSDSLPVSRQQSFTTLSNLDKEEGSVMKLQRLGDRAIFRDLDSTSGEEIRKKLLSGSISDLDTIIENISKARDRGIAMRELFNERSGETSHKQITDGMDLGLENSNRDACRTRPFGKMDGDLTENEDTGSLINETYDKILRGFDKSSSEVDRS